MGRGTARGKIKGSREAPRSRSAGREALSGEGGLLTRCADTDTEDAEAATGRKTAKGRPARKLSKEGGLRFSNEQAQCILSMEPVVSVDHDEEYARMTNHPGKIYSQEFIDESVEIFRDIAEMNKSIFGKLQAWMRAELDDKGYVEVDDEYIARRELYAHKKKLKRKRKVNAFGPSMRDDDRGQLKPQGEG